MEWAIPVSIFCDLGFPEHIFKFDLQVHVVSCQVKIELIFSSTVYSVGFTVHVHVVANYSFTKRN